MKQTIKGFMWGALVMTILFLAFCVYAIKYNEQTYSAVEDSGCENLTLIETTRCLRNELRNIYNYTIREDTIKSLDDLKKNGGDCYDWGIWYKLKYESLGFKAELKTIELSDKLAHAFVIANSENVYCVVDQLTEPKCVKLGTAEIRNLTSVIWTNEK